MGKLKVDLSGSKALITGGAKRIGRELCLALAGAGADIAVHYNSSESEAEALRAEIENLGVKAFCLHANLICPAQAEGLALFAIEKLQGLDILINNASIFPESDMMNLGAEELLRNVQVNSYAPFELSRIFYEQVGSGCVINMLDCRYVDYDRKHLAYHLSKRMLASLTSEMAVEFAPAIRVNGIAPGLILPPEGQGDEYLENLRNTNPLCAIGSPQDITDAALFLIASEFITGQVVFVDGGRHLKGRMYG